MTFGHIYLFFRPIPFWVFWPKRPPFNIGEAIAYTWEPAPIPSLVLVQRHGSEIRKLTSTPSTPKTMCRPCATLIPALLLCTILTGLIKNNLYLCLIMLLSCGYSAYKLELAQFLINRNTYSEIYEKEYINPQNITFDFPDKKQNL